MPYVAQHGSLGTQLPQSPRGIRFQDLLLPHGLPQRAHETNHRLAVDKVALSSSFFAMFGVSEVNMDFYVQRTAHLS